jgi:hypothetical protein
MAHIPQEIIDQFYTQQGVQNLIIDNYGYSSTISPTGDFQYYNSKELAVYRLTVLICTTEGTYINDPSFGVKIEPFFKNNESAIESLKNDIARKIAKYEKDLTLTGITHKASGKNKSLSLQLNLRYNPTGESVVLSFGFIKDMQALTRLL